ncbi:hypothetical protein LBMAG42_26910 [Deltaproteobacteria bacterium]|nr:hypothetical protein LBMAG42_26910 [Deltaproteobacteria bacterium]
MPYALVILTLLGCSDTSDTSSGSSETAVDTGISEASDIQAELATIVTVVIVRWQTAEPTVGRVEFGADTNYGQVTADTEAVTDHEVLLVGNTADTVVHFRVVTAGEGGDTASADHEITTGPLPAGMPTFVTSGTLSDEYAWNCVPTQGTTPMVVILNAKGEIIWYYVPTVVGGNMMRALVTHDRKSVLLGHAGTQGDLSTGVLEWISLDGGTVRTVPAPNFDHDLAELPDGTVALIVVEERPDPANGGTWAADTIVEYAPDGTQTTVFNSWDAVDPVEAGITGPHNWTHGNGLDYDPVNDVYYFSWKEVGTLLKIQRATAEVDWMIDGKLNQFDFGDDPVVQLQHQFERLPDGNLLIFDNGTQERGYSLAVELELDEEALTANQVWQYGHVPPLYVFAKGDVQRFENGNTLVTWSAMGELQMVTPEGAIVWQLNAELGQAFTFVQPFQSFYADR